MYAPHHNPEMYERREHGRPGPRRGHGFRRGFDGQRPESGFERPTEGRPDGRRGRGDRRGPDRSHFGESGAVLRPAMGLLRGAAVAVAAGGTAEQVAKAETVLAEARRALFEMLAEKPVDTESTDPQPTE